MVADEAARTTFAPFTPYEPNFPLVDETNWSCAEAALAGQA